MSDLLGRENEVAAVEAFLAGRTGVLLLEGDAGIGKTTVWEDALGRARALGWRVLSARPAHAEAQISFAAIADLLGSTHEVVATLPPPQRRALEIALLVRDPHGHAPEQQEIAFAVLSALRTLADEGPLLVAVDDVQWLDAPSAASLQFALRRMTADGFAALLAWRTDGGQPVPLELERLAPEGLERLRLGGLSLGALQRLLHDRIGAVLPRPLLRRIHELSGGNPFFALELARFADRVQFDEHGELPLPESLHDAVRSRLAALPSDTVGALAVAAAASAPTPDLVERATGIDASLSLPPAVAAGVVSLESGSVRFTHPVLARAAYESVGPGRRRDAHRVLSTLVPDLEERARHLALSGAGRSADVADTVHEGAVRALSRGAPTAAVELLEHALRLSPEERPAWTFELADALYSAGEAQRALTLLRGLVEDLPPGVDRARVLWRLAQIEGELVGSSVEVEAYERALVEAEGDDALTAHLEVGLARMRTYGGAPPEGVEHATRAVALAERGGDPEALAQALAVFVLANRYAGHDVSDDVIERAVTLEQSLPRPLRVDSPSSVYSLELRTRLELDRARDVLERHLEQVSAIGDETAEPMVVFRLFDTELLSGRWDRAEWCAGRMRELAEPSGVSREYARLATALVAGHRGRLDAARAGARAGLAFAESTGELPLAHHNLALLGFVELSAGDVEAAVEHLVRWESVVRQLDFRDPYHLLRGALNEAESLVEAGRLEQAGEVLDWFADSARAAARDWPAAFVRRGRALVLAASGDLADALELLEPLADDRFVRALPLERARTELVLGMVRRRAKRRRAAREALEAAHADFVALGADAWAARTRAELERLGGRTPAGAELTAAERRVAELVAAGRTNKEAAAELFVSVHTVEAALTRVYGKLGVRSRTELANRMAGAAKL